MGASAQFILHNKKKTNGLQKQVGSLGSREYSAEDVGFTKVRAVILLNSSCIGGGDIANAKVPLIVVCVLIGVISLVLAAVLLISRRRKRYQHRPIVSSEEQTPFQNKTILKINELK